MPGLRRRVNQLIHGVDHKAAAGAAAGAACTHHGLESPVHACMLLNHGLESPVHARMLLHHGLESPVHACMLLLMRACVWRAYCE
jgi:hypothetical protein